MSGPQEMRELGTFLCQDGEYRHKVRVPSFVAEQTDYSHWEKDRLLSMEKNLKQGDILFDAGSELGWQSAIYAKFVGAENMCLFEAAKELWPTIKSVWEANGLAMPRASYCGLLSNRTNGDSVLQGAYLPKNDWPLETSEPELTGFDNWAAIHTAITLPGMATEIFIDHFVEITGIIPSAIAMDIEGAEKRALEGASATLCNNRPLVWVSIHPEVRLKKYGTSRQEILDFMEMCDYRFQYLGVDHEEHYFFYPRERSNEVTLVESPWMTNGKRNMTFEQAIPDWEDPWKVEKATWGKL